MTITTKMLESIIESINKSLGYEIEPYSKRDGKFKANPNTYYIGKAYGGFRIEQMVNEGGGWRDISDRGTKKECYTYLRGMRRAIRELQVD